MSRTVSTMLLASILARRVQRPKVFLTASAIGYYGNQGEEIVRETTPSGNTFLARVCVEWERAILPLRSLNVRCVPMRFGVVLGNGGGILRQLIPFFRMGLGAQLGSGRQWMSWVALEDLINAVHFILDNSTIADPVNVVSPNPVRNIQFTQALAKQLCRPSVLRIPRWLLRLVFREMVDSLLLNSVRAEPDTLLKHDFAFQFPELSYCLSHILKIDVSDRV